MKSQKESILEEFLNEIGDAIREVRGTKELINAQDMSSEIRKNIFEACVITDSIEITRAKVKIVDEKTIELEV
jgi:hypothetical protein